MSPDPYILIQRGLRSKVTDINYQTLSLMRTVSGMFCWAGQPPLPTSVLSWPHLHYQPHPVLASWAQLLLLITAQGLPQSSPLPLLLSHNPSISRHPNRRSNQDDINETMEKCYCCFGGHGSLSRSRCNRMKTLYDSWMYELHILHIIRTFSNNLLKYANQKYPLLWTVYVTKAMPF